MATERRVYPSINALRDFVQAELRKRKKGSLAVPTPTITPFVRMTSAMEDEEYDYRFFSIGLHGITDRELQGSLFELTYGSKDIVGYGYDTPGKTTTIIPLTNDPIQNPGLLASITTRNEIEEGQRYRRRPIQSVQSKETAGELAAAGTHPIPGITDVSVNYRGINDFISVDVTWKCYNATQLNFLRNHFLLAGQYVVIDFGHIISNRVNLEPLKPFDFADSRAVQKLAEYEYSGRLAIVDGEGGADPIVQNNNGNYDIFIGKIINSSISLQPDNTYECKTTVVSTGEVIYGATNHSLIADLSSERASEEQKKYVATLEEFFQEGGILDGLVASNNDKLDEANQPAVIDAYRSSRTKHGQPVQRVGGSGEETSPGSKLAADQYAYVSWNYFTHDILTQMFYTFDDQPVNAELRLFLGIGQPIVDVALAAQPQVRQGESPIGNHPVLTSVDYRTLIIVKEGLVEDDITRNSEPALFAGTKIFSDENDQLNKGYLSKGIYINVEAIKESFSSNRTFYDGMVALLRRMNNATANYWKLDIGFDEESKKAYVFDRGCVVPDYPSIPPVYLFNKGTEGELLGLTFDASYTDEVKTSIMISARTGGEAAYTGTTIQVLGRPSVTFGPDRHGIVLNENRFIDVLQTAVNRLAKDKQAAQLKLLNKTPEQKKAADVQSRETAIRSALIDREDARFEEAKKVEKQLKKYNNRLLSYVQLLSTMKGAIASDGLLTAGKPNNYINPIATEISLQITLMGISGIAFWDCFMVDKLPSVYSDHGVFLVNGLSHNISRDGWTTTIRGLYYFIWMDANEGKRVNRAAQPSDNLYDMPSIKTVAAEHEELRTGVERKRQANFNRIHGGAL